MPSIDRPSCEDKLGFEPYVKGIEDLVRGAEPDDLPIAVGIYGAWGSGKTSFMLQLRRQLTTQKDSGPSLPTVWFDAWKYDKAEDVRSALIYKILSELNKLADPDARKRVGRLAKGSLRLLAALSSEAHLSVPIPSTGATLTVPTIRELKGKYVEAVKQYETAAEKLSQAFANAVNAYLEQSAGGSKKLVVFVDDLDRCLPENVITILEALKLFLDKAPCVFVIGVDRTVVETAIQAHYGADPGVSGREYLDKIIQYPFNVPPADVVHLTEYFKQLMEGSGLGNDERKIIDHFSEGNPRIYHRILNAWRTNRALAPQAGLSLQDEMHRSALVLATVVSVRFPRLREVCVQQPKRLAPFMEWCGNPNPAGSDREIMSNNVGAFREFWEDRVVRGFFAELWTLTHGYDSSKPFTKAIRESSIVEKAFSLSARAT